jgi:hypothetical protein
MRVLHPGAESKCEGVEPRVLIVRSCLLGSFVSVENGQKSSKGLRTAAQGKARWPGPRIAVFAAAVELGAELLRLVPFYM